jgi:hypothetical protein
MRSFGSENTAMCLRLSDTESLVMGAVGGHVLTWTSANRTHCLPRLLRGGKSLTWAGYYLNNLMMIQSRISKCFILSIGLSLLHGCESHSAFIDNGTMTVGTIYEKPHQLSLTSYSIHYEYYVKGVRYKALKAASFGSELRPKLTGVQFPVVYLNENPTKSRMLIFEYDFEVLGLNHPDSLKWVQEYK